MELYREGHWRASGRPTHAHVTADEFWPRARAVRNCNDEIDVFSSGTPICGPKVMGAKANSASSQGILEFSDAQGMDPIIKLRRRHGA